MVGLRAKSLSSSRLLGDVAAESGASRHDFSKPQTLTADQLVSSGPKGGPGSPQDQRHKRILRNQATLQTAARNVVENPQRLRKALSHQELMDATTGCLNDVKGQLGKVVMGRVQNAFLETSLTGSRSPMRGQRLNQLTGLVTWAGSFRETCGETIQGSLSFMEAGAEALRAIQRAQELKTEAQVSTLGEVPTKARMTGRRAMQPAMPPGKEPRAPEVIVVEAMAMLRKWKHHEEVAHELCEALLTMAEVCGDDFTEEMRRRGLGVVASTVADIWSSKADVCRSALRLLSIVSIELCISFISENVASSATVVHIGLEALNRLAKDNQEGTDNIAKYGGRELIDDVELAWAEKDRMIHLFGLNLRRRLRRSKVKSLYPRMEVKLPPEDVIRIRGCFEAVDVDGSGEISEEELGLAFQMMGMKLDKKELHTAFLEVDLDGSGSVEWPEFLFLMSKFGGEQSLESKFTDERLAELREVFSLFDDDGNGSLDAKELALVLRSVGLAPSEQEIQRMIDDVDADGSGCIEWPEFLFLMSKNVVKPDDQHKFAFEFFDKEREGKIQKSDFISQMRSLSGDFTEEELEEMFTEAKFEDGDTEQLTYKEFVKMMMR